MHGHFNAILAPILPFTTALLVPEHHQATTLQATVPAPNHHAHLVCTPSQGPLFAQPHALLAPPSQPMAPNSVFSLRLETTPTLSIPSPAPKEPTPADLGPQYALTALQAPTPASQGVYPQQRAPSAARDLSATPQAEAPACYALLDATALRPMEPPCVPYVLLESLPTQVG